MARVIENQEPASSPVVGISVLFYDSGRIAVTGAGAAPLPDLVDDRMFLLEQAIEELRRAHGVIG